jgi:hypothetical protein
MAKLSPLSFAAKLTHEQREELYALLQTKTLAEGVEWCEKLGVKTSDSSMSDWFKRYRMIRKVEGFDQAADELGERLAKRGIDPLLAPKIAQQVFLLQAAEAEDAETFETMTKIIQAHVQFEAGKQAHADKMGIAEKRIKIQAADLARKNKELQSRLDELDRQRKAAEAAITKANKDGGMTDETVKVIRQALGMKTDEA